MPSSVALGVFCVAILGLFWMDRDTKARTSPWLWLAVIWFALAFSRSVGQWMSSFGWNGLPMDASPSLAEGSPLDRWIYTGLELIGLAVLVSRGSKVSKFVRSNGPVIAMFVYCAMSIVWSDFPDIAFKRWTKAVGDVVMVFLVLSDRNPAAAIKRVLARVSFILVPLSVLFIKYYPELGKGYGRWDGKSLYTGVATNKNALGAICLICGLASVWRFLIAYKEQKGLERTRQLMAHAAILAMIGWLLHMASSMTAIACFTLAGSLLFATQTRSMLRKPWLVHTLVVMIIAVSAAVLFLGVSPTALQSIGKDPTLTDRTAIWGLVIGMTKNPLMGTGFESFWLGPRLDQIWAEYSWGPMEAHNGYIEIYLQLGWIGLMLLGVVIVTGYRRVIAAYRNHLPAASLMLSYFVVGVVYNFTEAAYFRIMTPVWIFFLMAIASFPALAMAKARETAVNNNARPSPSRAGMLVNAASMK